MTVDAIRPDRIPFDHDRTQNFVAMPRAFYPGCWELLSPTARYLHQYLAYAEHWATGVCAYSLDAMLRRTQLAEDVFLRARDELIAHDLVAVNDRGHMQRLSLPERFRKPPKELLSPEELEAKDPAKIRAAILRSASSTARGRR